MKVKRWMHSGAVAWLGTALPFGGLAFAQAPRQLMSEEAFKNIQVLKGIPVDEFMGTMGLFSAALNVCCGDCHVGAGGSDPKWEADDKPEKRTARRLVTMVNKINKENFGGAQMVTCWTCHHGSTFPSSTPPIDSIYSDPSVVPPWTFCRPLPANLGQPSAEQISRQIYSGARRSREPGEAHQLYFDGHQPFVRRSRERSGRDLCKGSGSSGDLRPSTRRRSCPHLRRPRRVGHAAAHGDFGVSTACLGSGWSPSGRGIGFPRRVEESL